MSQFRQLFQPSKCICDFMMGGVINVLLACNHLWSKNKWWLALYWNHNGIIGFLSSLPSINKWDNVTGANGLFNKMSPE